MTRVFQVWIASIFSLFLSACVSQEGNKTFDSHEAAKARIELGLGYLSQHDFARAKQNFDKALSHAPNYYLSHAVLAYLYQKQGHLDLARHAYEKAIKLDKNQGDVLNNYGAFLCQQGEFEQAYKQFSQALNAPHYYQHADTYENLVWCASFAKDAVRYQQNLQHLTQFDPNRAKKFPPHIE
ncbi:type IV pilus biogenesis/stability protein PilW [Pasteurella multocida]|uniref:type IV pilus biogenesis/stability protein PilW n=1 Tax=Pasteurella multocida TaxID=747 RepID=UPI00202121BA|nr:type IV pilus biogenesis/stability protein PilW [Pasteurella multocida]MCL7815483.1 type IV pilus biogenesis/stability protein PilW [Pasteurella multocida]MDY0640169.1 type IV pilus biogenesis/stability protein PilW [Pasteurella multocida]HDR1025389.1 type IV pilus biogenesis/stability protein PilW [Pasteurella multocida]HEP1081047.1 type IV pilus biogenesis/stability protein PilW [Pasteurella multocida]